MTATPAGTVPAGATSVGGVVRRGFGLCVALLALVGVTGLVGVEVAASSLNAYSAAEPAREAHIASLQALTDAETGVRGYRLTAQRSFLEPYVQGSAAFESLIESAARGADAETRASLEAEALRGRRWLREYAGPLAATGPAGMAERGPEYATRGKALFDSYRTAHKETRTLLTRSQERRLQNGENLQAVSLFVTLIALAVALLLAVGSAVRTHQELVGPLNRLRALIFRWTEGDTEGRADTADGPSEVREIARALNAAGDESQRANALRDEQERWRELSRDIARRIGRSLDTDSVLHEAVVAVGSELGADRAYIRLMGEDGRLGEVGPEWCAPGVQPVRDDTVPLAPEATPWVRELYGRGASWLSTDLEHATGVPASMARDHVSRTGARATLVVPIGNGTEVLGALLISQTSDSRDWHGHVVRAVESVAADLGRALVHASLYTRQHELVQQLREVDQAKTDFMSTVSHELRTPLTSISGYVELIRDGDAGTVTSEMDRMLEVVDRNTDRLRLLIEDLLMLSRIESGALRSAMRPVHVPAMVSSAVETVAPAASAANLRLHVEPGGDDAWVHADVHQLERVLLNLLSNAVKFTPAKGWVGVDVTVQGGEVHVAVTDTGIGIPQADQARLFSRFFRASNATAAAIQGTGLGLTIVRSIVEQHGGSLSLTSGEGTGTTVTVVLPLVPADATGDPAGAATAERQESVGVPRG